MESETHTANATRQFSIEFPVANEYLQLCPETRNPEFTRLRYSAITDNPEDFGSRDSCYFLRQNVLNRDTELFTVITMYNEDERQLAKTLDSTMDNIAYLCDKDCPRSWGPNGWMNAVVCIVADGRSKINPRVLKLLNVMGIYPDGLELPSFVNGSEVTMHLFEFTTQISVDENLSIRTHKQGIVPLQLIFCLKQKNAKKVI